GWVELKARGASGSRSSRRRERLIYLCSYRGEQARKTHHRPIKRHAGLETRKRMGQKVRPTGYRVGIMEDWRSRWYASKHEFADLLVEDFKIRKFIKGKYSYAGIPKIEIERTRDAVTVFLST